MAKRVIIQRSINSQFDTSGQKTRQWILQRDDAFLSLKDSEDACNFIMIKVEDIPTLINDLQTIAKEHARPKQEEAPIENPA